MTKPLAPPAWDDERFEADRQTAIEVFRVTRMQEPLEQYLAAFDERRTAVENVIEGTVDLSRLVEQADFLLTQPDTLEAIRYLAGPAISEDDLKNVAQASLAPSRIKKDPEMTLRVIETVLLGLDRNRFPWMSEDREPTDAERETAIVATAALIASQRIRTSRANESKDEQEDATAEALISADFTEVPRRTVNNLSEAPKPGAFYRESKFGGRKADLIVGVWDGRQMPIECKVSNSSTNSVKRLNNDAAAKAVTWRNAFGHANTIPTAVLSGVFKLGNLKSAQADGLTIFWAHDLDALTSFLEQTKR